MTVIDRIIALIKSDEQLLIDWLDALENTRNLKTPQDYSSEDVLVFFISIQIDYLERIKDINEKLTKQEQNKAPIELSLVRDLTCLSSMTHKTVSIIRISLWRSHIENKPEVEAFYRRFAGLTPDKDFLKLFKNLIPLLKEAEWK